MSWIDALYRTYEANQSHISPAAPTLLVPVAHIFQKAHVEVVLDAKGIFRAARAVPAEEQSTVIPCTEKSAGRTSSPQAHPLSDQLQYVATDLGGYGVAQGDRHRLYRELLDTWCESQYVHPWVQAVQRFVAGGTITNDLFRAGLLAVDMKGRLVVETGNEVGSALARVLGPVGPERALIRWRIQESGGAAEDRLWKNHDVWQSWIDFYLSTKEGTDLCYVTGETVPIATQHPKYIRFPGDSAKIISANDTSGFTYRGLFEHANQLCSVGYDASQRVHNALQWLISRQGRSFGDLVYVAWAVSGKDIPDMLADPLESFFAEPDNSASADGSASAESPLTDAGQTFAARFNNYISGYTAAIDDTERIVVLGVDSVSPGRLSVVYYRELAGSEFIERVSQWHMTGAWPQDYGYDSRRGRRTVFVGVPAPVEIAKAAYGERVDGSLKKRVVRDVVSCILDGAGIPRQLVEAAFYRVCNRSSKSDVEWNRTLGVTCSMVRLFLSREKGGLIEMGLDTERGTRDYLFGRMLAAAEQIERVALEQERGGTPRPTSAAKLFHRFADRPSSTWRTLDTGLAPYRVRLTGNPLAYRYERTIDEVMSLFDPDDFASDRPLSPEFLLGYHCQRHEYFKPKKARIDDKEDEDADS